MTLAPLSDRRPLPDAATEPPDEAARELSDWLLGAGRLLPDNNELFSQFCARLVDAGIALDRATLHLRALHPEYRGVSRIWQPGKPLTERFMDHGIEKTAPYLESPVRAVAEARTRLEWRLDHNDKLPFSLLEELRAEGYTHYVIAPFVYVQGLVNAISWATARPGGFSGAELGFLDAVLPALSAVVELKAMRRFIGHMLTTYVGAEAGRLILEGQVRRGDVREITAALMLVDLRDFSELSDRMRPRAVIRMLNEYFDCVIPPVHEQGGEVVEIMGDGVLAIFRQHAGGNAAEACGAALAAATQGLAALAERNRRNPGEVTLRSGAALHYGVVSYGNIGVGERLDFTVIGPDVNLTSRIERFCRELERDLIMSEVFAERLGRPMWELGHFELRGFSRMQRLFALPPEET
ncbi:MAG TPA: adenylate/guanylate cyclase domain-containing protein [Stellaceae bacterium]|nr:adenylate/guanylate cyclase domain-containing protein [Stellaceae bacterium]